MERKWMLALSIVLAIMMMLVVALPASADTTASILVTNTPQFISISVAPNTWTVNGLTGSGKVFPNTTYYANPGGDTVAPTGGGALDGECDFAITNLSNVAIDLTVTSSNMTGGSDNSANSDTGNATATAYGGTTYFTGQATADWVVCKSVGSGIGYDNLGATTNKKMGFIIKEQTNAWTGGTASTFTILITASAH